MPLAEAIDAAAGKLKGIIGTSGPQAVACWGSSRCSLETMGELTRLCRYLNLPQPKFFLEPPSAQKTRQAVSHLDAQVAVSLREIERADFILVAAADPLHEAPMLALALRQAVRGRGPGSVVLDPRPICVAPGIPASAVTLGWNSISILELISRLGLEGKTGEALGSRHAGIFYHPAHRNSVLLTSKRTTNGSCGRLQASRRPVSWSAALDLARETTLGLIADLTRLLRAGDKDAGLFYLLPGPNAFGAALLSAGEQIEADPVAALEEGTVKALVIVENDPLTTYLDRERLLQALNKFRSSRGLGLSALRLRGTGADFFTHDHCL